MGSDGSLTLSHVFVMSHAAMSRFDSLRTVLLAPNVAASLQDVHG